MNEETLADLMASIGLSSAWQGTPQNQPGYRPPRPLPRRMRPVEQRLYDPNAGVRMQAARQQQFRQNALADTMQNEAGRNEVNAPEGAYFGQDIMETTGAPSLARGVRSLQRGEPGQAAGEFAMGGLGALGAASLPFGAGVRALPQVSRVQPSRLPNAPPRIPTRATDGSILPRRPSEPFRNSLRGGGDDLSEAAAMRPEQARSGNVLQPSPLDDMLRRMDIDPMRIPYENRKAMEYNLRLRGNGKEAEAWLDRYLMNSGDRHGGGEMATFNLPEGRRPPAPIEGPIIEGELAQSVPDAGQSGAGQRVVYRGLNRPYDPANGGYYQSFTSSLDDAREYGPNVMAAHINPGRNLAIDGGGNNFNALSVHQLPADVRARLHPSVGGSASTDQIAHAAREAGYDSVTVRNVHDNRWGERPVSGASPRTIDFVFNTENISPLDHIPPQAAEALGGNGATLANARTRLSDADRALLDELSDLPDAGQWPTKTDAYHIVDVRGTDAVRPGRYGPAVHFDLDPAITTHLGDFGTTRAARFDYRVNGRFASPEQFRSAAEAAGSPEAAQAALKRQGYIGVRDAEFVAVWDQRAIGRAKPNGPLPPMSTRQRAQPVTASPDGGASGTGQRGYAEQLRADGFDVDTPLYHATTRDFEQFDNAFLGTKHEEPWAVDSLGHMFNTDPAAVNGFARGDGGNVRPSYGRLRNPLRVESGRWLNIVHNANRFPKLIDDLRAEARAGGHDGLIIGPDLPREMSGETHVIFDAESIAPRFGPAPDAPNAGPPRPPPRRPPGRNR